jgi:hypothetical protein
MPRHGAPRRNDDSGRGVELDGAPGQPAAGRLAGEGDRRGAAAMMPETDPTLAAVGVPEAAGRRGLAARRRAKAVSRELTAANYPGAEAEAAGVGLPEERDGPRTAVVRKRRGARVVRIRWARGTLLTPWFVLGAGLVVVAFVALQSPHPVLNFAQPDQQTCRHRGCTTHHPGSLTSRRHGVEITSPGSHGHGRKAADPEVTPSARPTAPATSPPAPTRAQGHRGVTIGLRVFQLTQSRHRSSFEAFIILQSSKKIGRWTLRFTLPGTHIDRVVGATWQESASGDGGEAVGQPWPWRHAGDAMVKITVLGTGRPGRPTGCVFDGVACTISG